VRPGSAQAVDRLLQGLPRKGRYIAVHRDSTRVAGFQQARQSRVQPSAEVGPALRNQREVWRQSGELGLRFIGGKGDHRPRADERLYGGDLVQKEATVEF